VLIKKKFLLTLKKDFKESRTFSSHLIVKYVLLVFCRYWYNLSTACFVLFKGFVRFVRFTFVRFEQFVRFVRSIRFEQFVRFNNGSELK
jgi:hypothetical protein